MRPAFVRWGWIALVVGAVGGLALAAQPWWQITGDGQGMGLGADPGSTGAAGAVELSGNAATAGLSAALATVCLVGTVLSLTLRRLGRRVLVVVLAVLGAGMVVLGAGHRRPSDAIIVEELRKTTLADTWTADATIWPWLYAAAGALVLVGAVVVFASVGHSARAERTATRFERAEDAIVEARTKDTGAEDADTDHLWQALDRGQDPTDPSSPRSGG